MGAAITGADAVTIGASVVAGRVIMDTVSCNVIAGGITTGSCIGATTAGIIIAEDGDTGVATTCVSLTGVELTRDTT